MLFALETEIHKYFLNRMVVQYTASVCLICTHVYNMAQENFMQNFPWEMYVIWFTKFTLSLSICIWILVAYSRAQSFSEYIFHY